jgi:hypothetical protein
MARIQEGPARGLRVRLIYHFTGRALARLREHFDDAQIMELTYHIALENLRGRFNLALGIDSAGFSDGMVCALPSTITGS